MRMDKRAEASAAKLNRSYRRKKQTAAFLLVFCLCTGLVIVDNACSEMTGHPEYLSLNAKRSDGDKINISFLGRNTSIRYSFQFIQSIFE